MLLERQGGYRPRSHQLIATVSGDDIDAATTGDFTFDGRGRRNLLAFIPVIVPVRAAFRGLWLLNLA